ncbi:hypothetical protein CMV14_06080 [Rhizorhabdus dicambivorans]|uniref:hypothetical protein n=1 Tax=Rhizorhabdus dicambivorans TaxID=1850238 RepID=UPI0008340B12|nr:hypothetical protein [Rhizorhabdus dicambivorans]ATE64012.1 hypothetical protein CMV14_06080 [Rhizorhabdus dicambivorans]
MARELTLSFAIKRGVVWPSDEDLETSELLDRCKRLIGMQRFKEACDLLLPAMSLSWTWSQADSLPTEFLVDCTDFIVPCTRLNSVLQLGLWRNALTVTAATTFPLMAKDEAQPGEFEQWLRDNSADWCGSLSGGWLYSEDDGAQLVLHHS